jgi:hypothetical protein
MFLRSATILKHVVPTAIAIACMTIEALEVEVPHIVFAVGGFSISREGRYIQQACPRVSRSLGFQDGTEV